MELLSKPEAERRRTADRKMEIDEGIKVARRVDTLRKTVAEEEKRLAEFRTTATQAAMDEIRSYTDKRDRIKQELAEAEEALRIARLPLDDEWFALSIKARQLEDKEQVLASARALVQADKQELDQGNKRLRDEQQRVSEERERTKSLLSNADLLHTEARQQKEAAAHERAIEARDANNRRLELDNRQASIEASEKRIEERNKAQDAREQALNDREVVLADREATLLRNIKRNG